MARLHVFGDISAVFSHLAKYLDEEMAKATSGLLFPTSSDELLSSAKHRDDALYEHYYPSLSPCIVIDEIEKFHDSGAPGETLHPQRLMCELNRLFPENTCFFADTGNSFVWGTHYLFCKQTGAYRVSMGFASMGWAIGAAVGNALANRKRPVVSITGDGSFLMHGMELTVAVQEKLPIVFIILNDNALGMVMHGQRLNGAEQTAYELPPIDFAATARTLGANGLKIRCLDDLMQIDGAALCQAGLPTVLDIDVNREEVPPMGLRIKTLQN